MGVIEASDRAWKVVQMTDGKHGSAEWLRGIIDEYEAEPSNNSCSLMAKLLGIECGDTTCRECPAKMMTAVADRIESERALPEGVEWPRFEDGELVKVGDEVECEGDVMDVVGLFFEYGKWRIHVGNSGTFGFLHGKHGERVKRPTPKVLGADGAPIEVGDVVCFDGGCGRAYVVAKINANGGDHSVDIVEAKDGWLMYSVNPENLTHERPDSWERIEEDAKLAPRAYLEKRGMNPEKTERVASMMADLVRRAKALAKAGEQG